MRREEIRYAIGSFFEVLDGDFSAIDRESRLVLSLDRLALAYHFADYQFDERDYPDSPEQDYNVLREKVSIRFPECGYYNVALDVSVNIAESSIAVGDAI